MPLSALPAPITQPNTGKVPSEYLWEEWLASSNFIFIKRNSLTFSWFLKIFVAVGCGDVWMRQCKGKGATSGSLSQLQRCWSDKRAWNRRNWLRNVPELPNYVSGLRPRNWSLVFPTRQFSLKVEGRKKYFWATASPRPFKEGEPDPMKSPDQRSLGFLRFKRLLLFYSCFEAATLLQPQCLSSSFCCPALSPWFPYETPGLDLTLASILPLLAFTTAELRHDTKRHGWTMPLGKQVSQNDFKDSTKLQNASYPTGPFCHHFSNWGS